MRTTELVTCAQEPRDRLGPAAVRAAVHRWMRLVAADAELAPYLLGTDRRRLAALLALAIRRGPRLTPPVEAGAPLNTSGVWPAADGGWCRPPLTEEQRWRVLDYLAAALWALDLPVDAVVDAQRAVAGLLRA
ncbi:globin [Micromonospora sp. WMMC241]|uniref:globin n=1 Tax=Micromonospora sp. WMMC241 TaxID=3015159 RepID=UPI0022B616C5|nr:globin [Micromonospora sp. WMMC241]MCZ7439512.1 globin [Micromonospora sp. WMMC241]